MPYPFGFQYDAFTRCRSSCQVGVRRFRKVVDEMIPERGDFGCFNCRPTANGGHSIHGEGRATDEATPRFPGGALNLAWNTRYGDWLVSVAHLLGIQRVIGWGPRFDGTVGPREWDSRNGERRWEHYSGPLHQDHNHVEFCWDAALHLEESHVVDAVERYWDEEDWLSMATEEQVRKLIHDELSKLAVAILSKDEAAAKAAGAHFGASRDESVMDVLTKTRSYAKAAKENTDEG